MSGTPPFSKKPSVSRLLCSGGLLWLGIWLLAWVSAIAVSRWVYGSLTLEVFQVYFPLKCPLKWFLGIPCPTCGLGRSIILFLAGQIRPSLDAHILGPVVVLTSASASLMGALWPSLWGKVRSFKKSKEEI